MSFSQTESNVLSGDQFYDEAFTELKGMLDGTSHLSFKRSVFITENAFYGGTKNYIKFNSDISKLTNLCRRVIERGGLLYNERDKNEVAKYWAVFMVMKKLDIVERDSVGGGIRKIAPFRYDFTDFWGEQDWTNMFVHKLMETNSGNCHSLPFLYKILCEELGGKAYLAMAPNHIYIKHYSKKDGWYNTELTSGQFPIDAWIMASGYVHLNAIQNGIYMDTLSQKQSISVALIDLAKGYEKKFHSNENLNFTSRCADLALKYYPNYVNGLILKAEVLKRQFEQLMRQYNAEYPSDIFQDKNAKMKFDVMEKSYFKIHQLGYRMMPKEMYEKWLDELSLERDKYANKTITSEFNSK